MNILVCGTRTAQCADKIFERLESLPSDGDDDVLVVAGGGPGPDTDAVNIATGLGYATRTYYADWKAHGRAAGPIRNQKMLDDWKFDIVLAFWDGKSPGTRDMIQRAERAGLKVEIVKP